MSVCEHMLEPYESTSGQSPEEKLVSIQNELLWGLTYRNYKDKEKEKPLQPVHSPIHIPFELCRARMRLKTGATVTGELKQRGDGEGTEKQTAATDRKVKKKKRKLPSEKPTLLDRNVWSQDKYMDYLSIPHQKFEEPKPKKYKKRCELEPCPPRFVQLAVPKKRRVFSNWKDYANFLPAEMLMRFEEILHTDQNLEPKEARYYYKKLDKQKHQKLRKKRLLEKKKKLEKAKDSDKMQTHIDSLAYYIVKYIQDEPLFALNYKQMLLSDGILDRLEATGTMKKPSRKTKNHYKKTVIEVSDKLAIWIDTLTKFVDVQAIESDADIPPVSIASLIGEGEEESEGESEYESSEEEELRDSQLFQPIDTWGEEGGEEDLLEAGGSAAEAFMTDFLRPGEGEGATDLDNMLTDLDGDALDKLIEILSNCSDDFLDSFIDEDQMPEVRYRDVLERLKELKENLSGAGGKPFLEQIMIDWATRNDPDHVDDVILQKIHEVAGLLGELVTAKRPVTAEEDWNNLIQVLKNWGLKNKREKEVKKATKKKKALVKLMPKRVNQNNLEMPPKQLKKERKPAKQMQPVLKQVRLKPKGKQMMRAVLKNPRLKKVALKNLKSRVEKLPLRLKKKRKAKEQERMKVKKTLKLKRFCRKMWVKKGQKKKKSTSLDCRKQKVMSVLTKQYLQSLWTKKLLDMERNCLRSYSWKEYRKVKK